jgi:UDP-glucose 4-epimerase
MRILISGAHGYIGSKLVARLRGAGHVVGVIVRRAPTFESAWTRGVDTLLWDMARPHAGEPPEGYDLLIHAAGANDIDSADPREALLATALSARHVVDFCREARIARVIYFSTFQVFGRSEGDVTEDSPVRCLNDYALTHWFAEQYLRMAERNGQLDCVVVRPTNVYGTPLDRDIDRWTLVPGCFCKAAVATQSIVLRSSGHQYRNFVHLDAVADAAHFLAQNFDRAKGRTCILAGDEVLTIRSVVEDVVAAYQRKFAAPCRLVIESNLPAHAAPLHITATNLPELGYRSPPVATVGEEIERTIDLLGR